MINDNYQLAFGASTLMPLDGAQDVKYSLVGPLPAYNPDHTYSFKIYTGLRA